MILVTFYGHGEMKTKTLRALKDWFAINSVGAVFTWANFREHGFVESKCGRWLIREFDGRALSDVPWLEDCAMAGGDLLMAV